MLQNGLTYFVLNKLSNALVDSQFTVERNIKSRNGYAYEDEQKSVNPTLFKSIRIKIEVNNLIDGWFV